MGRIRGGVDRVERGDDFGLGGLDLGLGLARGPQLACHLVRLLATQSLAAPAHSFKAATRQEICEGTSMVAHRAES